MITVIIKILVRSCLILIKNMTQLCYCQMFHVYEINKNNLKIIIQQGWKQKGTKMKSLMKNNKLLKLKLVR